MTELALFLDWYVPGGGARRRRCRGLGRGLARGVGPVADDGLGPVTVLRDYHAENIMLLEGAAGIERFGLLDFQDALAGHPAYDLVSLLQDARRDVSAGARAGDDRPLRRARPVRTSASARLLGARGAAQHAILGVFSRLWKRDGKARYMALPAARVGPAGARPRPSRAGAGAGMVRRQYPAEPRAPPPGRTTANEPQGRALSLRPGIDAKVPDTAMVMAAGLGKRMRPLTATRPKPLVGWPGKALIDHVLDRLRAAGRREDRGQRPLSGRRARGASQERERKDFEVTISDERELLLETGGGMVQAQPLIDADPFLVVNSDNIWIDGPAERSACWRRTGATGRWTRCCCSCRRRARQSLAGRAIFT